MRIEIVVPSVGEVGMEITFVRWLKAEGDAVEEGDDLFEVDTDKTTMEVEAYASGVLKELRVGDGDTIEPGQVVAVLVADEDGAGDVGARQASNQQAPADHAATAPVDDVPSDSPTRAEASPPKPTDTADAANGRGATPSARRAAREREVAISDVRGSGPDGLVTRADVLAVASAREAAFGSEAHHDDMPEEAGARARHAVARRTTRTWQQVPHFHLSAEMDFTSALEVARPTLLVCRAALKALQRHPECNVSWSDAGLEHHTDIDLGLLVDTDHGLLIGRVPAADRLRLGDLEVALRELTTRARMGTLEPADFGRRTLTVSNLGMFAVDQFTGVLASPDPLLLSMGRLRTAPRQSAGSWIAAQVATLTLSVDHRALDGAEAARILDEIESVLHRPEVLYEND